MGKSETGRIRGTILASITALLVLSGCADEVTVTYGDGTASGDALTILVGDEGYRDVLEHVSAHGLADGVEIELVDATDDANRQLAEGHADLVYFQTQPAFLQDRATNSLDTLSVVSEVNVAPYALYSAKWSGIEETDDWVNAGLVEDRVTGTNLPHGATVALADTVTGFARGLYLLQTSNLITLDREFGGLDAQDLAVSEANILESQRHLSIRRLDLANFAADAYRNYDAVVLDPRTAASIGLIPERDALKVEPGPNNPYARVLVAPSRLAGDPRVSALGRALEGEEVADYLEQKYRGAYVSVHVPRDK
ncbi:MetQ/NlpA family ABC transporter substrate-binding protein [Rhodococcus rhodochrous]|uniref:ABC transporter substrate-binding protein n=1 Tax=Rhodococcus rhodochrous TaxID=1829 RepID=A0AA47ABU8_RHORH|nr:MetQ/NlpA family ABC transporter substrate-binding protein [Rhodococcus rhodochrous]UZF46701.1 ABC transporter substrate-binding protein [Rhodococcus rhodochrous]